MPDLCDGHWTSYVGRSKAFSLCLPHQVPEAQCCAHEVRVEGRWLLFADAAGDVIHRVRLWSLPPVMPVLDAALSFWPSSTREFSFTPIRVGSPYGALVCLGRSVSLGCGAHGWVLDPVLIGFSLLNKP